MTSGNMLYSSGRTGKGKHAVWGRTVSARAACEKSTREVDTVVAQEGGWKFTQLILQEVSDVDVQEKARHRENRGSFLIEIYLTLILFHLPNLSMPWNTKTERCAERLVFYLQWKWMVTRCVQALKIAKSNINLHVWGLFIYFWSFKVTVWKTCLISPFVVCRETKVIKVWGKNYGGKWWQNVNIWVNYPFKNK